MGGSGSNVAAPVRLLSTLSAASASASASVWLAAVGFDDSTAKQTPSCDIEGTPNLALPNQPNRKDEGRKEEDRKDEDDNEE